MAEPHVSGLIEIIKEESNSFQLWLGRMSQAWAETELSLYSVLVRYARVSDPVARALFSGMRSKGMCDAITAILENTAASPARKTDFDYVKAQIGAIQNMRDMLIHYATTTWASIGQLTPDNHKRILTDMTRAKRHKNARTYYVDSKVLERMYRDMSIINTHLSRHTQKGRFKPYRPPEPSAWQYKSLQPERHPPQIVTIRPTPRRQRGSSNP
jgi:hypothetical protein